MAWLKAMSRGGGGGRRRAASVAIGGALTLTVAVAGMLGWLARLEQAATDQRARWCAFFTPTPSDRVVHVQIDDMALQRKRWPWPRVDLATVAEELRRAGAATVAFDILFDESQPVRYEPVGDSGEAGTGPRVADGPDESAPGDDAPQFRAIDDDARLAEAIGRHGSVLLAVSLPVSEATGPTMRRAIERLAAEPMLTAGALIERLGLSGGAADAVRERVVTLKRRALRQRLRMLFAEREDLTLREARAAIFPEMAADATAPELAMLAQQYRQVRTLRHLERRLPRAERDGGPLEVIAPIWELTREASGVGSVTFEPDSDGKVRSVPLWIAHGERLYPHFALATACEYLDVPLEALRIEAEATVLPDARLPDGTRRAVRIPTMRRRIGDDWQYEQAQALIPWPTNAGRWEYLFDPERATPTQQLPIGLLIEAPTVRADLAAAEAAAQAQLAPLVNDAVLGGLIPTEQVNRYAAIQRRLEELDYAPDERAALVAERAKLRAEMLDQVDFLLADLRRLDELSAEERRLLGLIERHRPRVAELGRIADEGQRTLARYERRVGGAVDGAVCLVGWTATASITDMVSTSLDPQTPGVIVHGSVVNGILTDHFVARGPVWLDAAMVLLIGLAVTLIAAWLPPIVTLGLTVVVLGGYAAVNGLLLYDRLNLLTAAAGPLLAGLLGWVGVTVYRLVSEQRERARITKQFKNYVSRDLVDLIVENPSRIKTGRHELTCLFSDIAGFTTVSERLGPEQTIRLLNEYLRAMTERIMAGRGTVNKYLGDGIMAFWGAPLDDEQHALHGCESALDCLAALRELQERTEFGDLPRLFMRVGMASGPMMVGDCGAPPDRSDYTVIGDTVNLASRLEGANKQFGTQVLLSQRTHELVEPRMLARPIGRLQVVGRTEPETVYELLARRSEATADQRELAERTAEAVAAFVDGDFLQCGDLFQQIAERHGRTRLVDVYQQACNRYLEEGAPSGFRGALVLTAK